MGFGGISGCQWALEGTNPDTESQIQSSITDLTSIIQDTVRTTTTGHVVG